MTSFLELTTGVRDASGFVDPSIEAANLLRAEAQAEKKDAAPKEQLPEPPKAEVDVDAQGLVRRIARTNGTVIEPGYAGRVMTEIKETRNGHTTTWTKDATEDRWRSMDYIGAQRINYRVEKSGDTSFEDVSGTKYVTHGDGSQTRRKADGSVIEIDKDFHISSVTRADGSKLLPRYTGSALSEVEEVKGGKNTVWKYDSAKDEWTTPGSNEVRKRLSVSDLGNYAYISAKNSDVVHIDYADGVSRDFEWTNGRCDKITEKNGASTVFWQRDAATDNFVSGTTKEERKNVAVALNGDYSYVDGRGYKHIHRFDVTEEVILPKDMARSKAVQDARDDLLATAGKAGLNAKALTAFTFDLDKFEERAHSQGLKEAQVVDSMKEIGKILQPGAAKPFVAAAAERVKLAEEVLQHLAYPRAIDQGYHDTCGATTAEVYVCSLYPESFASLVREVADSGQFGTKGGFVVKPDDASLRQDWEAKNRNPYDTGAWGRSYASQIYQVIGINAAYQAAGSDLRYMQGRPQNPKDTGERVWNVNDGSVGNFVGMYDNEVRAVAKQTSGHEVSVLRRDTNFTTEADLRTKIQDLQKQGQLPAVMWVSTKNEPFWTATGRGRGGGTPGGHYVTLWDMDPSSHVLVDNQWGRSGDYESVRRLTLTEVFNAGKQ